MEKKTEQKPDLKLPGGLGKKVAGVARVIIEKGEPEILDSANKKPAKQVGERKMESSPKNADADRNPAQSGEDSTSIHKLQDRINKWVGIRTIKGVFSTGASKDVQWWGMQERRSVAERYGEKGFFEKYGSLLGLIFLGLVLAFTVIYTLNKIAEISGTVTAASVKVAELTENIAKQLQSAQNVPTKELPTLGITTPVGK